MAKIIKFPPPPRPPKPVKELDDFELITDIYYGVYGFEHFEEHRRIRLRDEYWELYDILFGRRNAKNSNAYHKKFIFTNNSK